MRLRVLSDLHIRDHGPPDLPRWAADPPADVILLAGDIHRGAKFIQWMQDAFPERPVVCVAGNHEYYDGYLDATLASLRRAADPFPETESDDPAPEGMYLLDRLRTV
jgi:predicted phosphodiesterase